MSGWNGRKVTELRALTLATYGTVCHLCGRPGATTADHVVARAAGGTDSLDNLRPAHLSCNSARGAMSVTQFRQSRRYKRATLPPSRQW